MGHDVYLCYDEEDLKTANHICNALEENGVKCWFKNRDVGVSHIVDGIMGAIDKSTLMILILSDNSKNSNFVNSEIDLAFDLKKQIIIYKIDGTVLDGSLEFFLNNKPMITSNKNPLDKLDELTKNSLKIIKGNRTPTYKKYALPILAVILIVALMISAFSYFDIINNDGGTVQIDSDDITIQIVDFHVDDVRNSSTLWNYSYFVSGQVTPQALNSNYVVITDFYDSDGNLVNSTEIEFTELQKLGNNYIFASLTSDMDNIERVEVQLADKNNIILAQNESQLTEG